MSPEMIMFLANLAVNAGFKFATEITLLLEKAKAGQQVTAAEVTATFQFIVYRQTVTNTFLT